MSMSSAKYSSPVLKKLNSKVGDKLEDLEHLRAFQNQLQQKKDDLENELAISNKSSDSVLCQLLRRAQTAAAGTSALQLAAEPLLRDCDAFVTANSELCSQLEPPLAAAKARLKQRAYRARLGRLTQLSDAVHDRLSHGATDEALARLRDLHQQTAGVLAESRCRALAEYGGALVTAWYDHLLRLLTAALDAALAELRYPLISTNSAVSTAPPGAESQAHLQAALRRLSALAACGPGAPPPRPAALAALPPAALPVRLLLRPLRKRFMFHFCGDKQTNNPAKPEWYMGQVLQWITDHETFLETAVVPTLAQTLPDCRPRLEFCRGLVQLVVEKLSRDLPHVQYDDATLSHTIDESIQLHGQLLLLGYGGSPDQPGPLDILCRPPFLVRWLSMERKYAMERMDAMLASETAWDVQGDPSSAITEVADGVLTLLQAMTERYQMLPEPGQRLQFLELQLELLDDLRVRLLQVLRSEKQQPLSSVCCALLNTAHHLRGALAEWGERPAMLHLHYLRRRLEAAERQQQEQQQQHEQPPLCLDQVLTASDEDDMAVKKAELEATDTLAGLDTTAFDASVQLFGRIEDDIVQLIVDQVLLEVRARSRPYRKYAWFAMQPPGESVSADLSPTACPMLQALTECVHKLKSSLAAAVLVVACRRLAERFCDFLYDELVMANRFSAAGGVQLRQDVTCGVLTVFAELPGRPELALRPLLAACSLLTLPTGSALLLRDALTDQPESGPRALAETGVHGLGVHEALEVLQRRTAMSVV